MSPRPPARPAPPGQSPLTAAASLAKARAAPWQPLSRRKASTSGNRSLGTGRRSAMMPHADTCRARARANALLRAYVRAYVPTYVRACVRACVRAPGAPPSPPLNWRRCASRGSAGARAGLACCERTGNGPLSVGTCVRATARRAGRTPACGAKAVEGLATRECAHSTLQAARLKAA